MKSSKSKINKSIRIPFNFGSKHKDYMARAKTATFNIAEGAIRAGKTVDNIYAFAWRMRRSKDRLHLATGSTMANAKLNIGDANGFGLEYIFRGQCRWTKYRGNEALLIQGPATKFRPKYVIFVGAGKADSFKKIRGNSYGSWIATEVNLHHKTAVQEAFNRTAAADDRCFFWDLNPDHPKHPIYRDHIDKYTDMPDDGAAVGGVNYEHFTLDDNINISDIRKQQIKAQYDPKSIWYQRDIKGRRMIAEGLIYEGLANGLLQNPDRFYIDKPPGNLTVRSIGIDFGGSASAHAFVCTGITWNYEELIALRSATLDAHGVDTDKLIRSIYDFTIGCVKSFGGIDVVYCDSAEQVLINSIRSHFKRMGLHIRVENSLKMPINERINLTRLLIDTSRLKFLKGQCQTLEEALTTCIWNPKELTANERLDDGTSDIDTLDGFEYSFERYAARLIRR